MVRGTFAQIHTTTEFSVKATIQQIKYFPRVGCRTVTNCLHARVQGMDAKSGVVQKHFLLRKQMCEVTVFCSE